jgi:hypothetical protein
MTAQDILDRVRSLGVTLKPSGTGFSAKPRGLLPPELIQAIRDNKPEVRRLLAVASEPPFQGAGQAGTAAEAPLPASWDATVADALVARAIKAREEHGLSEALELREAQFTAMMRIDDRYEARDLPGLRAAVAELYSLLRSSAAGWAG